MLYPAGNSNEPIVLPELLTQSLVLDHLAIRRAQSRGCSVKPFMKTKLFLLTSPPSAPASLFAAESRRSARPRPDFAPDAQGKTESLGDYKGKYVVLEWFNPGCPFVQKHYKSQNMQALQKEFTKKASFG